VAGFELDSFVFEVRRQRRSFMGVNFITNWLTFESTRKTVRNVCQAAGKDLWDRFCSPRFLDCGCTDLVLP
jgi:hypothetical protein